MDADGKGSSLGALMISIWVFGISRGSVSKPRRIFDIFEIWFNLPYHDRILRKSERVRATRITREPSIFERNAGEFEEHGGAP
jgi:hypothetical protein